VNFRSQQERTESDLNITPLIDVVFLLLIFFMVSTTFQKETQLKLQLPQASDNEQPLPEQSIEVTVNASGKYYLNGTELSDTTATTMRRALARVSRGKKDVPLVIKADARASHQAVVTAMDAAAQLGMVRISIATADQH
jgi:biopolymer transport protein ExbD